MLSKIYSLLAGWLVRISIFPSDLKEFLTGTFFSKRVIESSPRMINYKMACNVKLRERKIQREREREIEGWMS